MNYLGIELQGINANGEENNYKLRNFNGNKLIVYFYPQDDTPVCTKEAQLFRDAVNKIKKKATVIGVSEDDIEAHLEFKEKHNLNFILLSDKENKLKKEFKKYLKQSTDIHRSTFILDENGNIIKAWEKVDVDDHLDEILSFLEGNA